MSNKHYAYIDALRGFAILAVIATHTSQITPDVNGTAIKFLTQGARGVELFFLTSALTLMMSWHERHDGTLNFYIRRLFRIVPMFWLGIIFYSTLNYFASHSLDWSAIFMTSIFANGWNPVDFNKVVPGGWSIAVEMNFYLIFPLLAYYFRNLVTSFMGLIGALLIAYFSFKYAYEYRQVLWPSMPHGQKDDLTWFLVNLWLPNELPIFMTGICLYFAIQSRALQLAGWVYELLLIGAVVAMVFLAGRNDPFNVLHGYLSVYSAYGFVFAVFALALAKGAGKILVNRVTTFFGKISFSAYLWHFAVLGLFGGFLSEMILSLMGFPQKGTSFFLCIFPLIVMITAGLSYVTYVGIEKPMIRLGNQFIIRFNKV